MFFFKYRQVHFYINSTRVIQEIKLNKFFPNNVTSSGRLLMHVRRRVGRMEPCDISSFAGHSSEYFPPRITQSHLFMWNKEIKLKIWWKIPKINKFRLWRREARKTLSKDFLKWFKSDSNGDVKSSGNYIIEKKQEAYEVKKPVWLRL